MNKIKKSLITIEQVSDYLDNWSFADVWNGIVNAMGFMITLIFNIILFPIVIIRLIKNKGENNE